MVLLILFLREIELLAMLFCRSKMDPLLGVVGPPPPETKFSLADPDPPDDDDEDPNIFLNLDGMTLEKSLAGDKVVLSLLFS